MRSILFAVISIFLSTLPLAAMALTHKPYPPTFSP